LFRIAPLFWLAAAFYTGFHGLGATPENPAVGTPQILATLVFLHGWHPTSINSVVPGGWSIAVEMNFYLLLPLCFLWIDSLKRAVVSFLIVAPLSCAVSVLAKRWLTGADPTQAVSIGLFTYYWFPRQAPVFLLGFILFFLVKRARAARADTADGGIGGAKLAGRPLLALASLGLVALSLLADRIPVAYLVFSVAWMAFALGLSRYPTKAIVNPLLRYCGKVSYSAYLTHFFVLDKLSGPLMRGLDGLGLPPHSPLRFASLYLAAVAGTLLLSTVTYHLIESPGQQLGRYLIGRLDAGPAPALQAS
jgi:peptidoglycan/LPS O-acetylase OafA/YrhL